MYPITITSMAAGAKAAAPTLGVGANAAAPIMGLGAKAGLAALALIPDVISGGFNLFAAEQNRDFQRDMANTAHQREVNDLIKAGLNPILSANSGAPTPSGSQAAPIQMGGFERYLQYLQTQAQVEQAHSAASLTNMQAQEINQSLAERLARLQQEIMLLDAQTATTWEERKNKEKVRELLETNIADLQVQIKGNTYDLSQKKAYSDYFEGVGKSKPYQDQVGDVLKMVPGTRPRIPNRTIKHVPGIEKYPVDIFK